MSKPSIRNFKKVGIEWVALWTSFLLISCERTEGRLIDSVVTQRGDLEFLVVRHKVAWYDELTVGYYCRSPQTATEDRNGFLDYEEPTEFKGKGWRSFRGYINSNLDLKSDNPLAHLEIYDARTAYLEKALTMTFDGCRTRVYFNVSSGARFAETMQGKGIRYPETSLHFGERFLRNLKIHEGGGCFEINPFHVDEQKQYYYCSSDIGKTWTLETERKQSSLVKLPSAAESKTVLKKPS